jgi:hypothetical protein
VRSEKIKSSAASLSQWEKYSQRCLSARAKLLLLYGNALGQLVFLGWRAGLDFNIWQGQVILGYPENIQQPRFPQCIKVTCSYDPQWDRLQVVWWEVLQRTACLKLPVKLFCKDQYCACKTEHQKSFRLLSFLDPGIFAHTYWLSIPDPKIQNMKWSQIWNFLDFMQVSKVSDFRTFWVFGLQMLNL